MDKLRLLFFLLLVIIVFTCCKNTKNHTDIMLRNFFYQVDNYETEKVLVYEHDSSGIKTNNYFILKKVDNGKLLVKRLSQNFHVFQTYVDIYKKDGIYLESATFMEGQNATRPTDVQVINGKIFPFDDLYSELPSSSSFRSIAQPNIKGIMDDKWQFEKIVEKEINGKKINVIYANVNSEITYVDTSTGQKSKVKMKMEVQYTEGIGLTNIKSSSIHGTFKDTYIKTISIEDFNKIKP